MNLKLWSDEVVAERAIVHRKSTTWMQQYGVLGVSRNGAVHQCNTKLYGLEEISVTGNYFSLPNILLDIIVSISAA